MDDTNEMVNSLHRPVRRIVLKAVVKQFTWKNLEPLEEQVKCFGERYYGIVDRIPELNRGDQQCDALENHQKGLHVSDPILFEFVLAFDELQKLRAVCELAGIHRSLFDLTLLPMDLKYDFTRKLKTKILSRDKMIADVVGQ